MNKKIVGLILVILISFCFLTIVVADNVTHNDNDTTDHDKTIDEDVIDEDVIDDDEIDNMDDTPDENKTDEKPKKHYILAKGSGNDIKFSDGFRGFILDYSKSPAKSGDEFKRVSTSKASNSNTLKLTVIECYKQDSAGQIGKIMADFIKTGSSSTPVGKAVASSHVKVSDCVIVKINSHTEAVFDFEVLKSVYGNESDYFAYKESTRTIYDGEDDEFQTSDLTNMADPTNLTNITNITNITPLIDNETNDTFIKGLYDYLDSLVNALYESWKPIIDTAITGFLMIVNALEGLTMMLQNFITVIQSLIDAIRELIKVLGLIWEVLGGILRLLELILNALQQIIGLIISILNLITQIVNAIISLIQQFLDLLYSGINFLKDLINQIMSSIQAILDFLNSVGSLLVNIVKNMVTTITLFVIITIGALIYDRKR